MLQEHGKGEFEFKDVVALTRLEHHSNIVPWQILAKEKGFDIVVIEIDEDGPLCEESLKAALSRSPKLLCVAMCQTHQDCY